MSTSSTRARAGKAARTGTARPSDRLLRVASELFAAQGIRAVGIDQILRDAGVARASLYSWYGSKDALVLAYLTDLDQADRKRWRRAASRLAAPGDKVLAFFDLARAAAPRRGYRGCLYANAAAEFPGVDLEPVRAHRRWMHATMADLLTTAGVGGANDVAHEIQLLYDGALAGAKMQRCVAPIVLGRRLAADVLHRATGARPGVTRSM
ncbi:TetR family transcriptional regulator [Mycobacterium sp. E2462]|uniref:TetR/AcrR family transcriptional regulator n=1 Tax=Mycobacterium sp. E2462 TaxID=1834133 RepID=UPI0008009B14|nr:TetR/AcrR family transcriptional regulator [Mycobacterium sp. E2462]OBI15827.1 TetR family transcriptional regulator [Mycobacterium sp. E2462]